MRQPRLRGRNACLLADSFAHSGSAPVVDVFHESQMLDPVVAQWNRTNWSLARRDGPVGRADDRRCALPLSLGRGYPL